MNREKAMNYIQDNFSISGETGRLIQNILNFADGLTDYETRYEFLSYVFYNTIGLTDEEIKMIANI
jgi:hypothetical protein